MSLCKLPTTLRSCPRRCPVGEWLRKEVGVEALAHRRCSTEREEGPLGSVERSQKREETEEGGNNEGRPGETVRRCERSSPYVSVKDCYSRCMRVQPVSPNLLRTREKSLNFPADEEVLLAGDGTGEAES